MRFYATLQGMGDFSRYWQMNEATLKEAVFRDFFSNFEVEYDRAEVDFWLSFPRPENALFAGDEWKCSAVWAEAKRGESDINKNFVQLILTVGRSRLFNHFLPPFFLAAFNAEKIAFVPYDEIAPVFLQNDFNWNVAASDYDTKEFRQLFAKIDELLSEKKTVFNYQDNESDLRYFVKENFLKFTGETRKREVTKSQFRKCFDAWQKIVRPTIAEKDLALSRGIQDVDFFIADLVSENEKTLDEGKNLHISLNCDAFYQKTASGDFHIFSFDSTVHAQFWNFWKRPPKPEVADYLILRRDLLVPQDYRERKGSFFTPQIWVKKSQEYLAAVLGDDWQSEYYVWDCCAGTGNLLNGLTEYGNVWASTLDKSDVDVMKQQSENGGSGLFLNRIFQFDFLNDDFSKLPPELLDIINDEEKRKKLVIYINPPYASSGEYGKGDKRNVTKETATYKKYISLLKTAGDELFILFLTRIYKEIPGCILAEFSKLKHLQSPNFKNFRHLFDAQLEKLFVVPANTFDNVKGEFPIGFHIWNLDKKSHTDSVLLTQNLQAQNEKPLGFSNPCDNFYSADIFDKDGEFLGVKKIIFYDGKKYINEWIKYYDEKDLKNCVGFLGNAKNDFQCQNQNYLSSTDDSKRLHFNFLAITRKNLIPSCVYFAVRHCIEATWLNDRDQFLFPQDGWQNDREFQTDCLVFALFHGQNRISASRHSERPQGREESQNETARQEMFRSAQHDKKDTRHDNKAATNHCSLTPNHWIPFTESEVGSRNAFRSHFMSDFLRDFLGGKVGVKTESADLFGGDTERAKGASAEISAEAQSVFDAGRALWRYYFSFQDEANFNADASFYDIRERFQGRDEKTGRMKNKSNDAEYARLVGALRESQKILAAKIAEKVYEYGFLK